MGVFTDMLFPVTAEEAGTPRVQALEQQPFDAQIRQVVGNTLDVLAEAGLNRLKREIEVPETVEAKKLRQESSTSSAGGLIVLAAVVALGFGIFASMK